MPIYEYKCIKSGTHVEKMQKVTDEPLTTCEACGGTLEKHWSLSGFAFKGEGWVTDYSKKSGAPAESSKSTEKSSAAESTASTETASKETSTTSTSSNATAKD